MLLSLNWLKEFVKIPRSITPEILAQKLTDYTVEVEKIENQSEKFKGVVAGKILTIKKHPSADRLQLVKVNVGKEELEIVCGATNIKPLQMVPVALIGAALPNGLEIKETLVRGEKSQGMLCAPDELGLGNDHSGIFILKDHAKPGDGLAKVLGFNEVVLEVDNKALTNRPDLWSHQGVAREISAFLNVKFTSYKPNKKLLAKTDNSFNLSVKVSADDLCPRYMAVSLGGIKVAPSPEWLAKRLLAVGLRPINNIVDATNYVMLELGQPLHAFDRNSVDKIIVRRARAKEKIETLDGEERQLDEEMLVIADSKKPIAIAGVMGGANSEISDQTDSITLESANFDFISIRKTAQKLSLRTESSMRFEKGLDVNLAEAGLIRAVELIKQFIPTAKVISGAADIYTKKPVIKQLYLDFSWLEEKLGEKIKVNRLAEILTGLGFSLKEKSGGFQVVVPSWRATRDIETAEDLAEEVARIYGYNNIKSSLPASIMARPQRNEEKRLEKKVREVLSGGAALAEVYNYSFVGEEQLKKLFIDYSSHLKLANPIASNQALLRRSLAPNLLENIRINQARYGQIGLFEIGRVYFSSEGELSKNNQGSGNLPYQEKHLGIILAESEAPDLFRKLKGIIEYLAEELNLSVTWTTRQIKYDWADVAVGADIEIKGEVVGSVNRLEDKIGRSLGLKKEVVIGEINLNKLMIASQTKGFKKYVEDEKYPPLTRDLAFVISGKVLYSDIREEIIKYSNLIKQVDLFDVYDGGKLGPDKKNLAFHLIYQATDRTLKSEEVDKLQAELIKRLEEKFEAKIRNF